MLYKTIKNNDNSGIAFWKIEEDVSDLLAQLKNKEIYLADFQKFSTEKRKKEWLAARILAETICGEDKIVAYNAKGKPFLTDNSFQISISHTKNYVALITHPAKTVGIDIEHISDRICRLKERFLSDAELQNIDNRNECIHLLLHWCAKEVLFKMINRENVDFSEQLCIFPFVPQQEGIFFGKEMCTKQQENYTFAYSIEKDFTLVWAVK